MKVRYSNITRKQSSKPSNDALQHQKKASPEWWPCSTFFRRQGHLLRILPWGVENKRCFLYRNSKKTEQNSKPGEASHWQKLENKSRQWTKPHLLQSHLLAEPDDKWGHNYFSTPSQSPIWHLYKCNPHAKDTTTEP